MKNITILGSTGSIGRQTLEVCDWFKQRLQPQCLVAYSNAALLAEQARKYQPQLIVLGDEKQYSQLKEYLGGFGGEVAVGRQAVIDAAAYPVDIVLAAISGIAGLEPVLAAIKAGNDLALANKESLVAGGQLVMAEINKQKTKVFPVDSEHSAIFQCLNGDNKNIEKLIITASGGPFRGWRKQRLQSVKPSDALQHPTWNMGAKVTIDSATLANKGLEVMEAHWLFDVDYSKIEVLVHKESLIHSLVQYDDGSIKAQIGPHDMRLPIQYALLYPERPTNRITRLDLAKIAAFNFERPDIANFPALSLAFAAATAGESYPAVFNGANEMLAAAFLNGKIGFMDIAEGIEQAMNKHQKWPISDIDSVLAADSWAKNWIVREYLKEEKN